MRAFFCALLVATQLFYSLAFSLPISIAEETLPAEVANDIIGTELLSSAHTAIPADDYWFVLVRSEDKRNSLRCYKMQEDRYSFLFETEAAIPQGPNEVTVEYEFGMEDLTTHTVQNAPFLIISRIDTEGEYIEFFTAYQYEKEDTWTLIRLWNYSEYGNLIFGDNSIQIYEDIEADQAAITEPIIVERDLRNIDLSQLLEDVDTIVKNSEETSANFDTHG